jgi:hypothetical protein
VNAATTRRFGDQIAALHGPALWTVAGFVLYVLGWIGSLLSLYLLERVLLEPIGIRPESGTLGLSVRNGLHAIVWGALVAAVAAPLGRRLVPGMRFRASGWAMLAAGLVVAAVIIALGNEFVRARYGLYDGEYQGLSFFAGPAVVAVALATWAALAVPRAGVVVPGSAMLTAAAGLAMSLLPSLPGATDGIEAASLPLVGGFLVAVGYAGLAAVMVVWRLGRPSA